MSDADQPDEQPEATFIEGGFSAYSGPIPVPGLIREYRDIQADFPERIMAMAEREQAHSHAKEKEELALIRLQITEQAATTRRASAQGVWVITTFLAASVAMILTGHDVAGTVIATTDLVALLSVFLGRQVNPPKDVEKLPPPKP